MSDWGRWGSADRHDLYVVEVKTRKRCPYCPKGARKQVTLAVCANGVCLASGCEWHARMVMRDKIQQRRKRAGIA